MPDELNISEERRERLLRTMLSVGDGSWRHSAKLMGELSERELLVAYCRIVLMMNHDQVAVRLGVNVKTVDSFWANARRKSGWPSRDKTGFRTRRAIAAYWLDEGMAQVNETKREIIVTAVSTLNDAVDQDREAVTRLLRSPQFVREGAVDFFLTHPTIQVGYEDDVPGNQVELTALGLINGLFGARDEDGYGWIEAVVDEDTGKILRFQVRGDE